MMSSTQRGKVKASLRSLPGRIVWRMPLNFELAKLAGPTYSLRCLLFHDISDQVSEFTNGLGVTLGTADFEERIKFISRHYTPVSLQEYLECREKKGLPRRPVLVTFDDAYASVALNAAPILRQYRIPAVFFVTASLVGNQELGLDNLICYIANTLGLEALRSLARPFLSDRKLGLASLEQVFDDLLPAMSQKEIHEFRIALTSGLETRTTEIAQRAQLYVNGEQLRMLVQSGFEIGNHTFSHVFCRSLAGGDFEKEIYANKQALESITGSRVRAFSVPYGSPVDLTEELAGHLRRSGHEAVFLARSRSNNSTTDLFRLNRIDVHTGSDGDFFGEVEILPRLRSFADILLRRNQSSRKAMRNDPCLS